MRLLHKSTNQKTLILQDLIEILFSTKIANVSMCSNLRIMLQSSSYEYKADSRFSTTHAVPNTVEPLQ